MWRSIHNIYKELEYEVEKSKKQKILINKITIGELPLTKKIIIVLLECGRFQQLLLVHPIAQHQTPNHSYEIK